MGAAHFLQALVAWLAEKDVVKLVLSSNLHQQQYAEQVSAHKCSPLHCEHSGPACLSCTGPRPPCPPPQAQRVLALLLKHRVLSDDSIAFLWQLTEGAGAGHLVARPTLAVTARLAYGVRAPCCRRQHL